MSRLNLSTKIAVVTAVLLIGFGTVMLATFSVLSARQIDKTIEGDAATSGRQLSLYLTQRFSNLKRETHFAAKTLTRVRTLIFLPDANRSTIKAEIPHLAEQFSVDAVQITDGDGAVLAESPELVALASSVKRETAIALSSGSEHSAIVHSDTDLYLMSCVPVRSDIYIRGSISLFEKLGAKQVKILAEQAGVELGLSAGSRLIASSLNATFPIPPKAGVTKEITLNGETYAYILASMQGVNQSDQLGYVILRPTKAIVAPYVEARGAFVAVFTVSLVLSLFGAVAVGRRMAEPISSLAEAARIVQTGEWPETFPVNRQDEIGVLQASFNGMIAATKLAQERLLAMIDLDPLTELRNHRSFRERLAEEARRCESTQSLMTLALIDIDDFDNVNESVGRNHGDEVIKLIAEVLRACVPEFSILARYAGDQFAALLPNTEADAIEVIMNFVRVRLKQAGCLATVSVGCAEFPKNSSREDGLILGAELALVRAKQLGKNRVCLFDAVPGADKAADPFLLYQSTESGSFATIQALAAAVDAKDSYTNGHSERVARYARDLSSALGDASETVDRVFRCGTLHDVGKIGVPDTILKKTGALDPDEQKIMQTHSVLGELIAGKVPQLADLLPGVRHHHERWDGRGYPDGLSGERIPYIARILAVADTYDAMTSDRPYRKGLAHDIAIGEIEKSAGSQFDPAIAAAFVKIHRSVAATEGVGPEAIAP